MHKTKKIVIKEKYGKFQYPIIIGNNVLSKITSFVKKDLKDRKVFIIYDDYFDIKKIKIFIC